MTTHNIELHPAAHVPHVPSHAKRRVKTLSTCVPIGRALFAAIFIVATPGHFSAPLIHHAAAHGVPMPSLLVPIGGIFALAGGLSVLLGYRTRLGASLILAFLVPVTLFMHRFWETVDPQMAAMDQASFFKNLALMGGALLLLFYGGGPMSLDVRARRSARAAHAHDGRRM